MGLVGLGEDIVLLEAVLECGCLTSLSVTQAFTPGSHVEKESFEAH